MTAGNGLHCLTVPNGGYRLPDAAAALLTRCPDIETPAGTHQLFWHCNMPKLQPIDSVCQTTLDGDEIETYPTAGYTRNPANSFAALPTLTMGEQSELFRLLSPPVPDAPDQTPDPIDILAGQTKPTEDNMALAFEQKYKDSLRFVSAWKEWLKWDGTRWKPDSTLLAFDYCRLIARDHNPAGNASVAKASFARGVESYARASRTFATEPGSWDRDTWLLNTPAGTIDLRDGSIRAHLPADKITKCCSISPKDKPRPIFERFLLDICCEDTALSAYLQRALGACLSGALSDNFFLFTYGTGQNGKSVLGELVKWMMGDYAKVVPIETLLHDPRSKPKDTLIANLEGVRLALSSEVDEGSFFDAQMVKSMTGDSVLPGRVLFGKPYNFTRTHKHLVLGNHRPMLRIVDPAIKKRIHLIPFKADFSDEAVRDPLMPQRLRSEGPQILQWLIEGHQLWMEDGYLKKCSAVEDETATYFDAQSTPDMWMEECCLAGEDRTETAKDLYASFKAWKEARGEGVMSQTRLSEFLKSRGFEHKRSNGIILYRGVELRTGLLTGR